MQLNKEFWEKFKHKERKALLDHELCHASAAYDNEGHRLKNSKGKYIFRTRKHDVEEFREIVDRHGIWKSDLQKFAESIMKAKRR